MSRSPSPAAAVALASLALLSACGETAAVVTVDGDLTVPAEIDGLCLAVADEDPLGGEFADAYLLSGELASLPQTLTVEPGNAEAAIARARGTLGGIEVARDQLRFGFSGISEVTLELLACRERGAGDAAVAGSYAAPAGSRVAASWGRGGTLLVVVSAGAAAALRPGSTGLDTVVGILPAPPVAAPAAVLAFDADGDCDDDLLLVLGGSGPLLWRRDGGSFVEDAAALAGAGLTTSVAAAAADVDGDADVDLAIGGGAELALLRNDGAGQFARDGAAIPAAAATEVSALAFGDVDADGHVDLAVGQGLENSVPPRLLFNDAAGTGAFEVGAAALPDLPLQVRSLAFVDADGDGARDLFVAGLATHVRLFVNRGDGRLEDRSFITLPDTTMRDVASVAAAEWGGDCFPDLAVGLAGGAAAPVSWAGTDGGVFDDDPLGAVAAGDQVLLVDVDDDGFRDLVVAGGDVGLTWVRRP